MGISKFTTMSSSKESLCDMIEARLMVVVMLWLLTRESTQDGF